MEAATTSAPGRLTSIWETPHTLWGWLATVDHKKVGKRYLVTAMAFLLVGGIEALGLIADKLALSGGIWDTVEAVNSSLANLGFAVVGIFVAAWGASALIYMAKGYDRAPAPLGRAPLGRAPLGRAPTAGD